MKALVSVLIFAISLAGTVALLPRALPQTPIPQLTERLAWFAAHKEDYDTVFIGSSQFYHGIDPRQFDRDAGRGTRSFNFGIAATFVAVLFYAVQIYCDFSGYSDMAIATSRMLGYELTLNFHFPYFSAHITEFWRRWHISLSTWLRDYLYISLGGNRGSKLFTWRNLMLTMLLGGLWHGASWTFVIWGGLHGLALIVHREWERATAGAGAVFRRAMSWVGPVLCFYWVCITWIFFRAQPIRDATTHAIQQSGFEVARTLLKSFVLFQSNGPRDFTRWPFAFLAALALVHWLCSRRLLATWWRRLPAWAFSALLGAGTALALCFVPAKYKAFIYFQF